MKNEKAPQNKQNIAGLSLNRAELLQINALNEKKKNHQWDSRMMLTQQDQKKAWSN